MRFIIQETERITKNEVFSLSDPKIHSVAVYKYVTCAKAEEIYFFVLVKLSAFTHSEYNVFTLNYHLKY